MGQYLFSCCGRTVNIPDTNVSAGAFPHLCIGDIPSIGPATLVGSVPATDVSTEAVDPVTGQVDGTDGGTATDGDGQ